MVSVDEKKEYIEQALEIAKSKGFKDFKANIDDYDSPKGFTKVSAGKEIFPDFTAKRGGKRHYFDIALKTEEVQPLVTKWKFLTQLAELKNSKLILFAPRGHKAFAERLVREYKISADIQAL